MKAFIFALAFSAVVSPRSPAATNKDYPYRPVPFTEVTVNDLFWSPRLQTNSARTVWYDFKKCEETGRINNFARAGGLEEGGFQGIPFNDSDVFKVMEGAAYIIATDPGGNPRLARYLDDLIAQIAASQEPDGYLYTARSLCSPDAIPGMSGRKRWSSLGSSHELYNVGHMYEAAVAHYRATGQTNFLNVAIKNADFLCRTFGPGKLSEPPGHEEIEIGLVKLYRATGNRKYLDLAKFFVDLRGDASTHKLRGPYQQDDVPIVKQDKAVGHAVRAGYFYAGVADVAAMTGQQDYIEALNRIWEDIVYRKMHLTGGIGARRGGEAFGEPYELPNRSAYLETCAAVANALWNHRLFLLHGDAKYIDVLERVIYNGFLSGISLEGDRFFYPNPLESDGKSKFNQGSNTRSPWFSCSCCPVNVVRFIPNIANYIYATHDDTLYVNLFIGGGAALELGNVKLVVDQRTFYPWDGKVRIRVRPQKPAKFTVRIRIPGWARSQPVPGDLYRYMDVNADGQDLVSRLGLKINGRAWTEGAPIIDGYLCLTRKWHGGNLSKNEGDVVELNLPMPVRRVLAHEKVKADEGLVAIERGPIVYCAEGADNDGKVFNLALPNDAPLSATWQPDLLNGVVTIQGQGWRRVRGEQDEPAVESTPIRLIPYYAWNHRGANEMRVWLPRTVDKASLPPAKTVANQSKLSTSFPNANGVLDAINDQIEPKSSIDHDVPRWTWWPHLGGEEWIQYDFDQPHRVSRVEVYWFDDTGRGACRVPESWRLLYRKGGEWREVEPSSEYGVAKDRFNRVEFRPVEATAMRLVVQCQPKVSSGVLEWKVE